jgi:hypothetical protein
MAVGQVQEYGLQEQNARELRMSTLMPGFPACSVFYQL